MWGIKEYGFITLTQYILIVINMTVPYTYIHVTTYTHDKPQVMKFYSNKTMQVFAKNQTGHRKRWHLWIWKYSLKHQTISNEVITSLVTALSKWYQKRSILNKEQWKKKYVIITETFQHRCYFVSNKTAEENHNTTSVTLLTEYTSQNPSI